MHYWFNFTNALVNHTHTIPTPNSREPRLQMTYALAKDLQESLHSNTHEIFFNITKKKTTDNWL
jgi:hypothetical protein